MPLYDRICDNLNLNTISSVYFWKSEWEKFDPDDKLSNPSVGYLIFRGAVMCYFIVACTTAMACNDMKYHFIFLTNLTITLQFIYSTIYFFRLLWVTIQRRCFATKLVPPSTDFQQKLPWPERIIYVLASITLVVPYVVTITYWIFIYDPKTHTDTHDTCQRVVNVLVHATNAVFAFVDVWVLAIPFRISSMIYLVIYAVLYGVFTGLYEALGGSYPYHRTFIYHFLDWKNHAGLAASAIFAAIPGGMLVHAVMLWGISRLRVMAFNASCSNRVTATPEVPRNAYQEPQNVPQEPEDVPQKPEDFSVQTPSEVSRVY